MCMWPLDTKSNHYFNCLCLTSAGTATAAMMKLFTAHSDVVLINQSSNFAKICWYRLMAKVDPFNNFIYMVERTAFDNY